MVDIMVDIKYTKTMTQFELENKIPLLRDERARNGWTNIDAIEHEYLMEKLRVNYSDSKYNKNPINKK